MTIVCVDNTPIMLEFLKENAAKAFPGTNVMSFPATEPALAYVQNNGCEYSFAK